jgi:integrase/recombinase XerD
MVQISRKLAIAKQQRDQLTPIRKAITFWADATTDSSSSRYSDLTRDKTRAVVAFFAFIGKPVDEITPGDVKTWQEEMEKRKPKLARSTIYVRLSFLSSFYRWAMSHSQLGTYIQSNPVQLSRPKRPKAFQSSSTKALEDEEMRALLRVVKDKALTEDLCAKRDYALLLLYIMTGMRRSEVIGLSGKDIQVKEDHLIIRCRVKGGDYSAREVRSQQAKEALVEYLRSAKRLYVLKVDGPVWTRHDKAGRPGDPLSSHSFVKKLKQYAKEAGIAHIHLHQTRHSYARIVSEETGSIIETQEALGHKNVAVTKVYIQRIAVKRDKHSDKVARRLQ